MCHPTTIERKSERELVITRTFDAPARLVFESWTKPELIQRWWTPKSFGITFDSCEADVRTGGKTILVLHEIYPSKQALDEALESGAPGSASEHYAALDELLATLVGS